MENLHHPPHFIPDDEWLMITASTYKHSPILMEEKRKEFCIEKFFQTSNKYSIQISAYVVLDDHYHTIIKPKIGDSVPVFIREFHGLTSFYFNKLDNLRGRQVWHNYWDSIFTSESDFWNRVNYIHQNPIKHGYVTKIEEWKFSSYFSYEEEYGNIWLDEISKKYPVVKQYHEPDEIPYVG